MTFVKGNYFDWPDPRSAVSAGTFNDLETRIDTALKSGPGGVEGLSFGGDTNIYRAGVDSLKTDDSFTVGGSLNTGTFVNLPAAGVFTWAGDTNLFRASADNLRTDDSFTVGGSFFASPGGAQKFAANATGISFFGGGASAKLAVAGSRSANAALASLLTQLAAYGLITDNSTA